MLCCVRCACLVLGSRVDLQLLVKLPNFFDFLCLSLHGGSAAVSSCPSDRPVADLALSVLGAALGDKL